MADRTGPRLDGRLGLGLLLLAGLTAIGIAMAAGAAEGLLQFIATRPPIVRAVLAGTGIVLGGWLLVEAIQLINGSIERAPGEEGVEIAHPDLRTMVRAIRLVFLSAASFTAAGGWLLGDPLPLVIALVIAGVDIVETSFLLLVASRRGS
jgi:hypothetical protein